jgi:DNA-binding XRE family transcriptional regulator
LIQLRRIELGLSVADVAVLTGICTSTLYRIEREEPDRFHTRLDVAQAIAYGLDSQLHTLFNPDELSEIGRPAKTGRPIVNISSKRRLARCSECNTECSQREQSEGISECCNAALAS